MSKRWTTVAIALAVYCLMLMPPPSAHAGVGVWTTSGPEAASVLVLALDPTTGTLYAGTAGGGVFKSRDGAQEWSVAGTELQARSVSALAIDPRVAGTMYAGTDRGVFKTTDGGASWSARNEGLTSL